MKTNSVKIFVPAICALTLCAGVVGGFLAARYQNPAAAPSPTATSSLALELALTPDQRQNMQEIWEHVRDTSDGGYKRSLALQSQRDEAIQKLIPADKTTDYNDILKKYQDENAALKGKFNADFELAVKKTKAILSPEQQKKYDQILTKRLGYEGADGHEPVRRTAVTESPSQPSS